MKMNISLMKLTLKLLILLIFFVILFLILAVLYSSRYWPDVYNYINANITIKRIPTLSELNLTILELDATTEFYITVEDYSEPSTAEGIDLNIDDFTNSLDELQESKRSKRFALEDFGKDYSELPKRTIVVDYLFLEETTTAHEDVIVTKIVRDLIDNSKLVPKNYRDVEIMDSLNEVESQKLEGYMLLISDDLYSVTGRGGGAKALRRKCVTLKAYAKIYFCETNVEYINTTSKNLPENFIEVKDVQISEIDKVLSEISSFIQQDITDQLKIQSDSAVFTNVNPDTKIYVKTFNYNNPGNDLLPDFENINLNQDIINNEQVTVEQKIFFPTPQTTTKSDEIKIVENRKDVSDNEIPQTDDIVYYSDSAEDNATDYPIIDYIDLYKDTTNEENLYKPTEVPLGIQDEVQERLVEYVDGMDKFIWDISNSTDSSENSTDVSNILPWISTIFLKNDTKSNQFEYFCDGALLNEQLLITAARCVNVGYSTVDADSILVILGKRSLLSMAENEQMVKIKQIITHENFTNENGKVENDLALLVLETPVTFNGIIQPASIGNHTEQLDKSFTTAWNLQGDVVPVSLEDKETQACNSQSGGENMFCAAYGQDVALCPSYGGIFAGQQSGIWQLYGIRSGDTRDRGLCFNKNVWFTDLRAYEEWIGEFQ